MGPSQPTTALSSFGLEDVIIGIHSFGLVPEGPTRKPTLTTGRRSSCALRHAGRVAYDMALRFRFQRTLGPGEEHANIARLATWVVNDPH
jgi:hypothetical protein